MLIASGWCTDRCRLRQIGSQLASADASSSIQADITASCSLSVDREVSTPSSPRCQRSITLWQWPRGHRARAHLQVAPQNTMGHTLQAAAGSAHPTPACSAARLALPCCSTSERVCTGNPHTCSPSLIQLEGQNHPCHVVCSWTSRTQGYAGQPATASPPHPGRVTLVGDKSNAPHITLTCQHLCARPERKEVATETGLHENTAHVGEAMRYCSTPPQRGLASPAHHGQAAPPLCRVAASSQVQRGSTGCHVPASASEHVAASYVVVQKKGYGG